MNKQSGFTLIEIVMVLVLLGILSAVAVPKYFDLQKQAEAKAAQAIAAEYQAQLNGKFAQEILKGTACEAARTAAVGAANTLKTSNDKNFSIGNGLQNVNKGGEYDLTVTGNSSATNPMSFKVAVPYCGDETTPSGS